MRISDIIEDFIKEMLEDDDSAIIDTPGIRSLDVSDFEPQEVQDYFQEFQGWSEKCKFSNCLHYREPENLCMVKQGVKTGAISKSRYESYIKILRNILNERNTDDRENSLKVKDSKIDRDEER